MYLASQIIFYFVGYSLTALIIIEHYTEYFRYVENFKLNKDECHFQCISISFFGEFFSRHNINPDPYKLHAQKDATAQRKKELKSFHSIVNYVGKF